MKKGCSTQTLGTDHACVHQRDDGGGRLFAIGSRSKLCRAVASLMTAAEKPFRRVAPATSSSKSKSSPSLPGNWNATFSQRIQDGLPINPGILHPVSGLTLQVQVNWVTYLSGWGDHHRHEFDPLPSRSLWYQAQNPCLSPLDDCLSAHKIWSFYNSRTSESCEGIIWPAIRLRTSIATLSG